MPRSRLGPGPGFSPRPLSPCLALLGLLAACGGPSPRPSDPAHGAPDVYRHWQEILTTPQEGTAREPVLRGYLEHRTTDGVDDGLYFVHDVERGAVGFVLPGGKAFAYERSSADGKLETREIAYEGLEDGILRLLGHPGERLILREVSESEP